MIFDIYSPETVTEKAKTLFKHERAKKRLDGWFIAKEKELEIYDSLSEYDEEVKKALILKEIVKDIPLELDDNQIFAGVVFNNIPCLVLNVLHIRAVHYHVVKAGAVVFVQSFHRV